MHIDRSPRTSQNVPRCPISNSGGGDRSCLHQHLPAFRYTFYKIYHFFSEMGQDGLFARLLACYQVMSLQKLTTLCSEREWKGLLARLHTCWQVTHLKSCDFVLWESMVGASCIANILTNESSRKTSSCWLSFSRHVLMIRSAYVLKVLTGGQTRLHRLHVSVLGHSCSRVQGRVLSSARDFLTSYLLTSARKGFVILSSLSSVFAE